MIGIGGWVHFARVVRSEVLTLRERAFIEGARATGAGDGRIMVRHVLPNVMPTVIVLATTALAYAIVAESSLSFLGVGIPASIPSWGGMLADGRQYVDTAWWLATFPGLCILGTALTVNVLGDLIRDARPGSARRLARRRRLTPLSDGRSPTSRPAAARNAGVAEPSPPPPRDGPSRPPRLAVIRQRVAETLMLPEQGGMGALEAREGPGLRPRARDSSERAPLEALEALRSGVRSRSVARPARGAASRPHRSSDPRSGRRGGSRPSGRGWRRARLPGRGRSSSLRWGLASIVGEARRSGGDDSRRLRHRRPSARVVRFASRTGERTPPVSTLPVQPGERPLQRIDRHHDHIDPAPGARANLRDHLDIGRVVHGQNDPPIHLDERQYPVVASVALADHGGHIRVDRPIVEIDEGDPELDAERMLERPLGDEPELDESLAERTVGLPLSGERSLEFSRCDGLRLDQHVPE